MRTTYDLEMMRQVGFCNGIENYSRHIDGRTSGSAPNCLIDYFPEDFLLVLDESHQTVPQIGAMYEGDMSRKRMLVEHGFRLPSAMDNRPLKWEEFLERIGQTVYLSATPGSTSLAKSGPPVEQIIRPTGLIDPEVVLKPTKGQIDDLMHEIQERTKRNERVLVTTLTKKMAEDLTDYLLDKGIRVRYLHSDIDTLRRVEPAPRACAPASSTSSSASTCSVRASTCPRSRSCRSSTPTRRASSARPGRSSRRSVARPETCPARCTCTPTRSPRRWSRRSTRPTGVARSRSPTTPSTASTRRRCARRSPTSPTCSSARTPTRRSLLGSGRMQSRGKSGAGRGAMAADVGVSAGGTTNRPADMAAADLAGLIQEPHDTDAPGGGRACTSSLAARLRDEIGDLKKEPAADECRDPVMVR